MTGEKIAGGLCCLSPQRIEFETLPPKFPCQFQIKHSFSLRSWYKFSSLTHTCTHTLTHSLSLSRHWKRGPLPVWSDCLIVRVQTAIKKEETAVFMNELLAHSHQGVSGRMPPGHAWRRSDQSTSCWWTRWHRLLDTCVSLCPRPTPPPYPPPAPLLPPTPVPRRWTRAAVKGPGAERTTISC